MKCLDFAMTHAAYASLKVLYNVRVERFMGRPNRLVRKTVDLRHVPDDGGVFTEPARGRESALFFIGRAYVIPLGHRQQIWELEVRLSDI
jgi:hypothetical protein